MITLAYPVHPTKGYDMAMSAPVVTCDHCNKIITADDPGNLLWDPDEPWQMVHDHKRCDWEFEAQLRDTAPGRYGYSRDIGLWLRQFRHNYTHPITRPQNLKWEDGLGGVETFAITQWRPRLGRIE
mgnify:CR=1 FL=1